MIFRTKLLAEVLENRYNEPGKSEEGADMEERRPIRLLERDLLSRRLEQFDYTILTFNRWKQWKPKLTRDNVLSNFKLVVMTAGRSRVTAGDTVREAGRGDVLLFAPFVRNRVECVSEEDVELYYLYFDLLPIEKRSDFMALFHCRELNCCPGLIPEHVFPQLELSWQAARGERPGGYYASKLLLLRTLFSLLQSEAARGVAVPERITSSASGEALVSRCIRYLDAHMRENVSVTELCGAFGVSQSYLSKCFTKAVGKSTKEFIVTYKLRRLEQELKYGASSMKALAEQYGFPSEYAFSVAFKKYYGVPPLGYRRGERGAE